LSVLAYPRLFLLLGIFIIALHFVWQQGSVRAKRGEA
jgi:hypothetical protein